VVVLTDCVHSIMQALDLIRQLKESNVLPIARAQMRIRVTMPAKEGKKLKEKVTALTDTVEEEYWGDDWELVRFRWSLG
jgi:ribosome maturation protein SDO1